MHSAPTRSRRAFPIIMAILIACSASATWAGPVTLGQSPAKPVGPTPNDLESGFAEDPRGPDG